jgi:hypothetical protein
MYIHTREQYLKIKGTQKYGLCSHATQTQSQQRYHYGGITHTQSKNNKTISSSFEKGAKHDVCGMRGRTNTREPWSKRLRLRM